MAGTSRLVVSTDALRDASTRIAAVSDAFASANVDVEPAAASTPFLPLSFAIREFSNNWSSRRGDLLDKLATLADAANGVAETFEETDTELSNAISIE